VANIQGKKKKKQNKKPNLATEYERRPKKKKESFYIPGYIQELNIKIWLLGIF
jgi:hypothetical protein